MANEAGAQSESSDLALPVISIWEEKGKIKCDLGNISLSQARDMLQGALDTMFGCKIKVEISRGRKILRTQEWSPDSDDSP